MKFICPHCSKPYDLPKVKSGQKAKCKSCSKEFVIVEDKVPSHYYCPRCAVPIFYDHNTKPGELVGCHRCGDKSLFHFQTTEEIDQITNPKRIEPAPIDVFCKKCGWHCLVHPQDADLPLRCIRCRGEIIVPGSRLFYLRSIRGILRFFFWLVIILLALTLIAQCNQAVSNRPYF
jgi:DNA-directed RNA polymerase subunit RPC12/RpoP